MPKAVKEKEPPVRWFKSNKQLGEVRLLPSNIDSRVLIRKPKKEHQCGGYGSCHQFSIVCMLNPKTRTINNNGGADRAYGSQTKGIKTPKIIFQYDLNTLALNATTNIGYYYRPEKERETLAEMLETPIAFNFTHVYDPSGYMCLTNRHHTSPRVLNNIFWDSSFGACWGGIYGNGLGGTSKKAYHDYIAFKKPERDAEHKRVLSNYKNYFETDKKPTAIFFSKNPKILAKAGKEGLFPGKPYVVGFAWFAKNRWWVQLKGDVFLKLTPEQVKAT